MAEQTMLWTILSILAGSLALTLLIGLFVLALVTAIFRRSKPYQLAFDAANLSPACAGLFGGRIEAKGITTGRIRMMGQDGTAHLRIPVRGPIAQGWLEAGAYFHHGEWRLRMLNAQLRGQMEAVDLLVGSKG